MRRRERCGRLVWLLRDLIIDYLLFIIENIHLFKEVVCGFDGLKRFILEERGLFINK